jgi:toxin ParE1/3/4
MAYKIIVSPRAQKEIENAVDYYALYSVNAPKKFIIELVKSYDILADNPFLTVRYKDVRALNMIQFPYSLFFVINENKQTVRVLSCFHNKRNPNKRP